MHVAEVATAAEGCQQVFVKAFPAEFQSNGLLNELVGYLVAKAAGLPVARRAYVLVLPSEHLFKIHPTKKAVLSSESGWSIAWATSTIEGAPLRVLRSAREGEMQKRLRKWGMLPNVLAFDDLVANQDRTDDNLIAVRNGTFALLDHADIAGGISRLHPYDPGIRSRNPLIAEIFGKAVPMSIKSGMVHAAETHGEVVHNARSEIEEWISFLTSRTQAEHPILRFLEERARKGPDRIRSEHGLLL